MSLPLSLRCLIGFTLLASARPLLAQATQPATRPAAVRTAATAVTPGTTRGGAERHKEFLNRIKLGDIDVVFLGDSITDFWPRRGEHSWTKFAPFRPANFGISGERTENILWRITNGELDRMRPKVVVMLAGTNNIHRQPADTPEWAVNGILKLVQTIREKQPKAKILLLGLFPQHEMTDREFQDVIKVNDILRKTDLGPSVRFLELGKLFLKPDGDINTDLMPDRLHPNAAGYEVWFKGLYPVLAEMMK